MLEMLIVVGVIAILLAIAIPGGIYASNKAKKNSTLSNMEVLANAIQQFSDENPLPFHDSDDRSLKNAKMSYGRFPPDWYSVKDTDNPELFDFATNDTNRNFRWDFGETWHRDDSDRRYSGMNVRWVLPGITGDSSFQALVRTGPGAGQTPDLENPNDHPQSYWTKDYRSIESLYLFISQLSPKGKMILDGLPRQMVTNEDLCGGGSKCPDQLVFDTNRNRRNDSIEVEINGRPERVYNLRDTDKSIDLFEVRDAWGTPLRYQVNVYGQAQDFSLLKSQDLEPVKRSLRYEWEIRSAGPDGVFANVNGLQMFVPEELSGDDVVRKGQ